MTAPKPRISLVRAFFTWCRDNVQQRGFFRAIVFFRDEIKDFIRDCTPSRRLQRYGDVEFDWEHRVDTTEATVSFRNRLLGLFHSTYQPTQPDAFRQMIAALGIDYSQFTFVDLGSGKGRTLLMASEYPFRRILGVELLPELHAIAADNLCKYRGGVSDRVQSLCADARDFDFPHEPLVLFLFHPFPQRVLEEVLARLMESLANYPRPIYVVYHNPVLEAVLANKSEMQLLCRSEQYVIFATGS